MRGEHIEREKHWENGTLRRGHWEGDIEMRILRRGYWEGDIEKRTLRRGRWQGHIEKRTSRGKDIDIGNYWYLRGEDIEMGRNREGKTLRGTKVERDEVERDNVWDGQTLKGTDIVS